jgi:hypothetical protein
VHWLGIIDLINLFPMRKSGILSMPRGAHKKLSLKD